MFRHNTTTNIDCLRAFQVIEQYDQPYGLPRAVHFDDETMRVFQACGLANEVVKTLKVNKGMKFVDKVSFWFQQLSLEISEICPFNLSKLPRMANWYLTGRDPKKSQETDGTPATGFTNPI